MEKTEYTDGEGNYFDTWWCFLRFWHYRLKC